VEVTIEFSFDFSKGVSRAFIRSRLISPVGVHNEPRAVVNVVELLAQGALAGGVTLHEHQVGRHGDVRSAVTVALDDLSITGVTRGFKADGAVFATDRGFVQVLDAVVGLVVPFFLIVFLKHQSIIDAVSVPSAGGILVTSTFGTSDGIVIHNSGGIHHALEEGVLVELGEIGGPLANVVRLIGEFLILVGKVNIKVRITFTVEANLMSDAGGGEHASVERTAEHFCCFL